MTLLPLAAIVDDPRVCLLIRAAHIARSSLVLGVSAESRASAAESLAFALDVLGVLDEDLERPTSPPPAPAELSADATAVEGLFDAEPETHLDIPQAPRLPAGLPLLPPPEPVTETRAIVLSSAPPTRIPR